MNVGTTVSAAFAASFAFLSAAASAASVEDSLAVLRRQVFQPQFLALVAPPPIGHPLSHKHCKWPTMDCGVEVTYGPGGTHPNNCSIAVQDVWMLHSRVDSVFWTIRQTPGGRRHRFFHETDGTQAWGILFADPSNDPGDGTAVPKLDVFELKIQSDGFVQMDVRDDIVSGPLRRGQPKAFYYAVRLQREITPGGGTSDPATWEDCDAYDPVAINRGN